MKYRLFFFITSIIGLLTACSAPSIQEYSENEPPFDPQVFFNNKLVAHGVVRDRQGRVTRWFNATIDARWHDKGGQLDEIFYWNDGEQQTRLWNFDYHSTDHYIGTAGDVVGDATMRIAGNAIQMNYQLELPRKRGKSITVTMNDWLYQVDPQTLISVTTIRKFGFKVGEVILTMSIVDDLDA